MAAILSRLGYRTGAGNTWTEARVRSLRNNNAIAACPQDSERTWIMLNEAAEELNVSPTVVRRLLRDRVLPGHQPAVGVPWIIAKDDLSLSAVQRAIKTLGETRSRPRTADCKSQVQLFQEHSEV